MWARRNAYLDWKEEDKGSNSIFSPGLNKRRLTRKTNLEISSTPKNVNSLFKLPENKLQKNNTEVQKKKTEEKEEEKVDPLMKFWRKPEQNTNIQTSFNILQKLGAATPNSKKNQPDTFMQIPEFKQKNKKKEKSSGSLSTYIFQRIKPTETRETKTTERQNNQITSENNLIHIVKTEENDNMRIEMRKPLNLSKASSQSNVKVINKMPAIEMKNLYRKESKNSI